jgi:hypothetical protein
MLLNVALLLDQNISISSLKLPMPLLDERVIDVPVSKFDATSFSLVVDVVVNPWIVHTIDSIRINPMAKAKKEGQVRRVSMETQT